MDLVSTVYFVSCVSKKASQPARARDLYESQWFLKGRDWVRARGSPDPEVSVDTHHLKRALRHSDGQKVVELLLDRTRSQTRGIAQSLIVTCRLHGIDPYTYLVDILQCAGQHPASRFTGLTPRLWTLNFADDPLRSALHYQ